MDRTIISTLEQMRDFDFVQFEHDALLGLASLASDMLSQSATPIVAGLVATQATPASLRVVIGAGRIYSTASADAVAVGSIAQDLTQIVQQGQTIGQTLTLVPPSAGQSQWNLIQCQFSQTDSVRTGDPNGGLVPFYNAANPSVPNTQSINTVRRGLCIIQVITGSAATTGSEVPPSPSVGWTPLYLIDLVGGQTVISTSQILKTAPSIGTGVPSNYQIAPFLAAFLKSHHNGNPGQAPKINLPLETTGVLPYANMSPVRVLLNAPLNLYVSPTGNDANVGTAPGTPFLTIQAAINAAYRNYDFGGNSCTINLANGTYTYSTVGGTMANFSGQPLGCPSFGGFTLRGNPASPGSVVLTCTNSSGIVASLGASLVVNGLTMTAVDGNFGYGMTANSAATLSIGNVVIGSCGIAQLNAGFAGVFSFFAPFTHTGTTQFAWFGNVSAGAFSFVGATVTVTGLTVTQGFVGMGQCCICDASAGTFIGSAAGPKFLASSNGVINTNGSGVNYFPGSTPGSTTTGGQYI